MRDAYSFLTWSELTKLKQNFNRKTDGRPKRCARASRVLFESHSSRDLLHHAPAAFPPNGPILKTSASHLDFTHL